MMWGWGGGWWLFGVIMLVACIYLMSRMMMGHGGSGHGAHGGSGHEADTKRASEILAERFARGEISEEDFEQRKRVLERQS
jgi:putative membrane protein